MLNKVHVSPKSLAEMLCYVCDHKTLEPLDHGILGPWEFRIMVLWVQGTLGRLACGTIRLLESGTTGPRNKQEMSCIFLE